MARDHRTPKKPKLHPLCTLFPPLAGEELQALAEDIKQNGLREDLLRTDDWQLIDGQSRMAACEMAGVEPRYEIWDGKGSLVDLVISRNVRRRHLDTSQRAMIASQIADFLAAENKDGETRANLPVKRQGRRRDGAARMMNVSPRSVEDAGVIRKEGVSELSEKVQRGEITINRAKSIAKLPKATQWQAMSEAGSKRHRKQKTADANAVKSATSGASTVEFAGAVSSTYIGPKFQYIFAPAPAPLSWWESENNTPPEAALELLRDMPLGEVAAENAVMVFWCRNHFLAAALAMLDAWGWSYSYSIAVVMRSISTVRVRDHHSHLLLMTHGERPPRLELVPSVVYVDGSPKKIAPAVAQFVVGLIDARDVLQTWGESAFPGWQMLADCISGDRTDDTGCAPQRHTLRDGTDDARAVEDGGSARDEATE